MRASKALVLVIAGVLAWGSVAPAWGDGEEENGSSETTEENVRYYYGRGENPFAPSFDEEQDEIFYFGESEGEDFSRREWSRFQDTTGKAARDMKKMIGTCLVATAGSAIAWSLLVHSEETRPYYWEKKYQGEGTIVSYRERVVDEQMVFMGVCLASIGIWLMRRN